MGRSCGTWFFLSCNLFGASGGGGGGKKEKKKGGRTQIQGPKRRKRKKGRAIVLFSSSGNRDRKEKRGGGKKKPLGPSVFIRRRGTKGHYHLTADYHQPRGKRRKGKRKKQPIPPREGERPKKPSSYPSVWSKRGRKKRKQRGEVASSLLMARPAKLICFKI